MIPATPNLHPVDAMPSPSDPELFATTLHGVPVHVVNTREDIATRDVVTRLDEALALTAAPVASSILHEGVHARVEAFGVPRSGRDSAREERLCRRAELAFGEALPAALGAPVIERARDSLGLADAEVAPVIDWQEAARRQDAVDRLARNNRFA